MRINLLEICRLLGSVFVGMAPETALCCPAGAAIDSRKVRQGDLFFCLPGEKVDGHDFAAAAVENGALAIIAAREPFGEELSPVPVFIVKDVVKALGMIAAAHRKTTSAVVVGVTGTSGKTTVKEVLANVLSKDGETAKNAVNLNNQIGLPLSICNASEDAAYWVMEAGISRPGDMDQLGDILRPDVALILNAGPGHVQELGSEGVAHHKARLIKYLAENSFGPEGFAAVSADYPELVREASAYANKIAWFSAEDTGGEYHAEYNGPEGAGMGRFSLVLEGKILEVSAPFQGVYGAENVAAIGTVAYLLGLTDAEILDGFRTATLPGQRFATHQAGAFTVVDDSYNANPLSMERMLDAISGMAGNAKKQLILVLGEMGELGPESAAFHTQLGRHIAALSPVAVFWKGGQGDAVAKGLKDMGFTGRFVPVGDADSFVTAFTALGNREGLLLFKGSRSNKLEELVAAFLEMAGNGPAKGKAHAL